MIEKSESERQTLFSSGEIFKLKRLSIKSNNQINKAQQ